MGMSSCPQCWDHPCKCGYEYRKWSKKRRVKMAAVILGIGIEFLEDIAIDFVPEDHPRINQK